MAYSKQTWVNGEAGATPLSAARLNHLEDGVAAVDAALTDKQDAGDYVTGAELSSELASKADASHTHVPGDISGTLSTSQIPSLAASKITSGTFAEARIPTLAQSKVTDLEADLAARPTSAQITSIAYGTELPGTVVDGQLFHVIAP